MLQSKKKKTMNDTTADVSTFHTDAQHPLMIPNPCWMLEKMGKARVIRLKACISAEKVFSSSTDTTERIVPLKHTAQNTSLVFDTPWHSPQTQTAPQSQTTHLPAQDASREVLRLRSVGLGYVPSLSADFSCFSFGFFREPFVVSETPLHRAFLSCVRCRILLRAGDLNEQRLAPTTVS